MGAILFVIIAIIVAVHIVKADAKRQAKRNASSRTIRSEISFKTPSGDIWTLFRQMLEQPHVLIAGCQGSGKSVAINGLINTILYRIPLDMNRSEFNGQDDGAQMILIDPKRVELAPYAHLPHTLAHASGFNPEAWVSALKKAVSIMDRRYSYMEGKGLRTYDKGDLYVIIDEWAAVYKNGGGDAYKLVMRLVSEGRAARVHVIMATQVPTAKIIPTEIRENFDARLCLRTTNDVQSRVIMGESGCEDLPRPADVGYAHGFYCHGGTSEKYKVPYVQESEINQNIAWWNDQMRQNGMTTREAKCA